MKKSKLFVSGILTGIIAASSVFFLSAEVKQYITPTQEFVDAKSEVAASYGVTTDDVSLYRHDMDSQIWKTVMDDYTTLFSGETEIYPHFVYTAEVEDKEEVLAVELASPSKEKLQNLTICGNPIRDYDVDMTYVTDRYEPVFIAKVNVSGNSDTYNITNAIDHEIYK